MFSILKVPNENIIRILAWYFCNPCLCRITKNAKQLRALTNCTLLKKIWKQNLMSRNTVSVIIATFITKVAKYLCSGGFFFSSDKFWLFKWPFWRSFLYFTCSVFIWVSKLPVWQRILIVRTDSSEVILQIEKICDHYEAKLWTG